MITYALIATFLLAPVHGHGPAKPYQSTLNQGISYAECVAERDHVKKTLGDYVTVECEDAGNGE